MKLRIAYGVDWPRSSHFIRHENRENIYSRLSTVIYCIRLTTDSRHLGHFGPCIAKKLTIYERKLSISFAAERFPLRYLPLRSSDNRFSDTAGLAMWRHNRSNFLRSSTLAATPACSENPATLPTSSTNGSSQSGSICRVNTLQPACGSTAMR